MTWRSPSLTASVREPVARNPMPGASRATSSHRRRDRRATSSSVPERRPLTQSRPKLRTDAPAGAGSASRCCTREAGPAEFERVPGAENPASSHDGTLHRGALIAARLTFGPRGVIPVLHASASSRYVMRVTW